MLTAQFIIGVVVLGILTLAIPAARASMRDPAVTPKALTALILGGSSIGLTGSFYYLSVAYASVSVSVVLLMQSVWMGIALDAVLSRRPPDLVKLVATVLVLSGTVVATNVLGAETAVSPLGFIFGMLAALSYTAVIWASKHLSVNLHPISRGFYMVVGGAVARDRHRAAPAQRRFPLECLLALGLGLGVVRHDPSAVPLRQRRPADRRQPGGNLVIP